jgi:hypothetical protein
MRKAKHERALKLNENFRAEKADDRDEIFSNGIFQFNITKLLAFIHDHPEEFVPEQIAVKYFAREFYSINEDYVDSVTSTEPVILAEIAPGRFNVIDGHHRIEKARRSGEEYIMAYRLNVNQHIHFLTTHEAYVAYVEYWNGKIRDLREDENAAAETLRS